MDRNSYEYKLWKYETLRFRHLQKLIFKSFFFKSKFFKYSILFRILIVLFSVSLFYFENYQNDYIINENTKSIVVKGNYTLGTQSKAKTYYLELTLKNQGKFLFIPPNNDTYYKGTKQVMVTTDFFNKVIKIQSINNKTQKYYVDGYQIYKLLLLFISFLSLLLFVHYVNFVVYKNTLYIIYFSFIFLVLLYFFDVRFFSIFKYIYLIIFIPLPFLFIFRSKIFKWLNKKT